MLLGGRPVHDVLRLQGSNTIAWAAFDPDWYLRTYPAVAETIGSGSRAAILRFYLDQGQGLGHSPNLYFDEAWHLRRYPRVAYAVRSRRVASAFDAYCRGGFYGRSPHWLFDEVFYRTRYLDLTEDYLASRDLVNGYDHYLRYGDQSGRSGHILFDPTLYVTELTDRGRQAAAESGCFTHYLRSLPMQSPEPRTTIYFDPSWHMAAWEQEEEPDESREWLCALHHYLCNDTPTAFDPLREFSERYYLGRYGDVAEAVESGKYRNGYEHFLARGQQELRSPNWMIDLADYVSLDRMTGGADRTVSRDAFVHYLTSDRKQNALSQQLVPQPVSAEAGRLLFRRKAEVLQPVLGRQNLDFSFQGRAELSVIMVLHNQFPLTLMAIESLRKNFTGAMELILIDSGSTDETRHIGRYISGAQIWRFEQNLGFIRSCNAALTFVTADFVLYLNNDVELVSEAIATALRQLRQNPRVGAVGGKIVSCHGLLQEAGSIIWRDGTTSGYLRGASPLTPEGNFVRTVDYCSAVFLLTRTDLVRQLEGFDDSFAPAYYEDADLCVRMAKAGYSVLYDPSIVVFHYEHGSATDAGAPAAAMSANLQVFVQKHADYLNHQPVRDDRQAGLPRFDASDSKRILFVEDTVPLRAIGSGFTRSNDIVRIMASLGYKVTIFPVNGSHFDIARVYGDIPESIEVLHDRSIDNLREFLKQRQDSFGAVWVARTHNLRAVWPALAPVLAASDDPPFVVLDTEAIEAKRTAWLQTLKGGQGPDLKAAIGAELELANVCRTVVAVSEEEAGMLRDLGCRNVAVLGHMCTVAPTPRAFSERAGMLFVGAIHHQDSPNYDSLEWFVDAVLPLVEKALGWETRLTVVGYVAPGVSLNRFEAHTRITLRGPVENTETVYNQHRIFVAPTRYAAGLPFKIYEAASFGIPVVTTELLRSQMNWENERDLLSASSSHPELFAEHIVNLYRDETLWQRIRANALDRLRRENSREQYAEKIADILRPLTPPEQGQQSQPTSHVVPLTKSPAVSNGPGGTHPKAAPILLG